MSLQMPQAIELPRAGLGEQLGLGVATGLQGALSTFMEEQKQKRQLAQKQKQVETFLESPEAAAFTPQQKQILKGVSAGILPEGLGKTILEEQRKAEELNFLSSLFQASDSSMVEPSDRLAPQERKAGLQGLSNENLVMLGARGGAAGQAAKFEMDRRKLEDQQLQRRAEFQYKRAGKVLERADELRETLPVKEQSLELMRNAIDEGDLSYFSKDNLANLTGVEAFRTEKGAQFINAGKEFLLGSLRRAGQRPNMFIEKKISEMLPQIGRSREANQTVTEAMAFETDVERERLRIMEELEDKYERELGYVPAKIGREADKMLRPFIQDRQKVLEENLKAITPERRVKESAMVRMVTPDGRTINVPRNEVLEAQRLGAKKA